MQRISKKTNDSTYKQEIKVSLLYELNNIIPLAFKTPKIVFQNVDYENFKYTIWFLDSIYSYQYHKIIYKDISFPENIYSDTKLKTFIHKNFFFLLKHVLIDKTFQNETKEIVFSKLINLYKINYFNENEMILYIRFVIILVNKSQDIRLAFYFFNQICSVAKDIKISNRLIQEILPFAKDIIIEGTEKSVLNALFINIADYLMFEQIPLEKQTQNILKDFLISFYLFQFRSELFNVLMKSTISHFDYFDIINENFNFKLDFLYGLFKEEQNFLKTDEFYMNNYFLFKSKQQDGIAIKRYNHLVNDNNNSNKINGFTILFGFKPFNSSLTLKNKKMVLLEICECNIDGVLTDKVILQIYLENLCLYIIEGKNQYSLLIRNQHVKIIPNKTYLFCLSQRQVERTGKSKVIIKFNYQDFEINDEFSYLSFPQHFTILLGMSHVLPKENNFSGYFGSFFMFNEAFQIETIRTIFKFKGEYDNLLLCDSKKKFIDKCIFNYDSEIELLSQFKICKKIKTMCTTFGIKVFNKSKKKFKANAIDLMELKGDKFFILGKYIKPVKTKNSLYEFVYFDGLKFIQLHCEYYIQLIEYYESKNTTDMIKKQIIQVITSSINTMFNLIEMFFQCIGVPFFEKRSSNHNIMYTCIDIEDNTVDNHSNELIFLFSHITTLLIKVAKFSQQTPIESIRSLLDILTTICIDEDSYFNMTLRNKLIYFLLNPNLYFEPILLSNSIFNDVCLKIQDCIESKSTGLIKVSFLNLILTHKHFIKTRNETFIKFINNYLKESFSNFKSNICLSLFDNILSYDITEVDIMETLTIILYENIIEFANPSKKKGINKRQFITNIYILSAANYFSEFFHLAPDKKDSIDLIISYLIQIFQVLPFEEKPLLTLSEKIQIFDRSFISFLLLCFEIIGVINFKEIISFPESFADKMFEDDLLQLNYNNLQIKLQCLIIIINHIPNEENDFKERAQRIFHKFILHIIHRINFSKDDSILYNKMKTAGIFDILKGKKYLYSYYEHFELNEVFQKEIQPLIKICLYFTKKPFIFKLLYNMLIKTKDTNESKYKAPPEKIFSSIYQFLISVINSKEDMSKFPTLHENFEVNRINTLIFSYKLSSLIKRKQKFNEVFLFFEFAMGIFDFETIYSRIQVRVGKINKEIKYKYIVEIIAEIYINLYEITTKKKYLELLESLILILPDFKCSFFYQIETQVIYERRIYEKQNPKEIKIDKIKLKETEQKLLKLSNTKFQDVSFVLYFYLKFSLFSMRKKNPLQLKQTFDKIKKILFKELQDVNNKIKKHDFGELEIKDPLYQKIKKDFTYDVIKKTLTKMNKVEYLNTQQLPKNSSKENIMNKEVYDLDIFLFRIYEKKEKKWEYIGEYFSYDYDKNGKIKLTDNMLSLSSKTNSIFELLDISSQSDENEFMELIMFSQSKLRELIKREINSIQKEECIAISKKKRNSSIYKINSSFEKLEQEDNYFFYSFPCINARKYFILSVFGEYFKEKTFNNEDFKKLIREYKQKFYYSYIETPNISYLPYPTKIKNYFTKENKIRTFLKPDLKFFSNSLISITHQKLNYGQCKDNLISFKNRLTNKSNGLLKIFEDKKTTFNCEYINIEGVIYGRIKLTENYIIFYSDYENDPRIKENSTIEEKMQIILSSLEPDLLKKNKLIIIRYSHIRQIFIKRFLFKMRACEIFLNDGKSFYFNFFNEEKNKEFFKELKCLIKEKNIIIDKLNEYFKAKKYQDNWKNKTISTFDYLCNLNFCASRSFNDINQYPVFPWLNCLSTNYTKEKEPVKLRDFSCPVSVQSEEKKIQIINKSELSNKKFKSHFNSHYSTGAFVIYFLYRVNPFGHNMIRFQNGEFDNPNRLFHSFYEVLQVLLYYSDNREPLPEIFFLPEMFINLNFNNFGVRTCDEIRVHNGLFDEYYKYNKKIINPTSNNPIEFMCWYRRFLELPIIGQNIHKWIDFVFGISQRDTKGKTCNLFLKTSYEEMMNYEQKIQKYKEREKNDLEIYNIIRGKINLTLNFGQTPQRLFNEKHPMRKNIKTNAKAKSHLTGEFLDKSLSINFNKNICEFNGEKNQIIYCGYEILEENRKIFYFITKAKEHKYELKIILKIKKDSHKEEEYCTFSLSTLSKFTLGFYDLAISSNNIIKKVYHTKYTFTTFSSKNLLAFVNYVDNTIKFYYYFLSESKNIIFSEPKVFIMQSMATSILKINQSQFITGHENGLLIHWKFKEIDKTEISISKVKSIIAQTTPVLFIAYNYELNIIITGDSYGYVSIRNFENFELLTVIKLSLQNKTLNIIPIKCQINKFNSFLYVLAFDSKRLKYILFGYTLNGIMFSYIEDIAGSFHILKNGNIITYCYSEKGFLLSRGERLNSFISRKEFDIQDKIVKFIYLEKENIIYYIRKQNYKQKMYLNKLELDDKFIMDIEKEEFYKEKENISIWENIEYDEDINENLRDSESKEQKK